MVPGCVGPRRLPDSALAPGLWLGANHADRRRAPDQHRRAGHARGGERLAGLRDSRHPGRRGRARGSAVAGRAPPPRGHRRCGGRERVRRSRHAECRHVLLPERPRTHRTGAAARPIISTRHLTPLTRCGASSKLTAPQAPLGRWSTSISGSRGAAHSSGAPCGAWTPSLTDCSIRSVCVDSLTGSLFALAAHRILA